MQNKEILPCPFCSSNNIGYSIKTKGIRAKKYHVAMYCKDCNCYGKRTIIDVNTDGDYAFRTDVERNTEYKQIAIKSWNTRKPMERIVEQLEEYEDLYTQNKSSDDYELGQFSICERVIDILKKGGVDNATN